MIYRFENVFPFVDHDKIYRYALQSFYKIGWEDSDDLDKKRYPSLHSTYNDNDIKYLNIIKINYTNHLQNHKEKQNSI